MRKIIITGGTGFIGRNLVEVLKSGEYELHILSRFPEKHSDEKSVFYHPIPENISELAPWVEKVKPEGIIHLATFFQASHSTEQVPELISANVLLGTMLLEAIACLSSPVWFLNIGTYWQHENAHAYEPVNLYAATKQAFEDIAKFYYQNHQIIFLTLCLNDTYGKYDTRPKIFNLWKKQLSSNQPLAMSPGEQIFDVLHISDVIRAIQRCIELLESQDARNWSGKIVYASAKEKYTLKKTAEIFEQIAGKKLNIIWGGRPYRNREIMNPQCFGDLLPGWDSKVSIAEGIRDFLNDDN